MMKYTGIKYTPKSDLPGRIYCTNLRKGHGVIDEGALQNLCMPYNVNFLGYAMIKTYHYLLITEFLIL